MVPKGCAYLVCPTQAHHARLLVERGAREEVAVRRCTGQALARFAGSPKMPEVRRAKAC
jgi:hypothetical protein